MSVTMRQKVNNKSEADVVETQLCSKSISMCVCVRVHLCGCACGVHICASAGVPLCAGAPRDQRLMTAVFLSQPLLAIAVITLCVMCVGAQATAQVWEPAGNLVESVLFFHFHVSSRH